MQKGCRESRLSFKPRSNMAAPGDVRGMGERRADGLARSGKAGVGGVDVEFEGVGHVPCHQGTDAVVHVGARIDHPHDGKEVVKRGVAIATGCGIEHVDGSATGTGMDQTGTRIDTPVLDKARHGHAPGCPRQRLLDSRSWKEKAAVPASPGAIIACQPDEPVRSRCHADPLENGKGVIDDRVAGRVIEWREPATPFPAGNGCRETGRSSGIRPRHSLVVRPAHGRFLSRPVCRFNSECGRSSLPFVCGGQQITPWSFDGVSGPSVPWRGTCRTASPAKICGRKMRQPATSAAVCRFLGSCVGSVG